MHCGVERGFTDELFPPDVDEAGLPVELDAVDEDPGEPYFDELPADDWDVTTLLSTTAAPNDDN